MAPAEIVPGIYQLKVPIPNNPLGWVLPYLIEGDRGWTLVDSGWNVPEAFDALERQVTDVCGGFSRIERLLVTHIHPDHYGLAGRVKEVCGAKVVIHQRERDLIRSRYWAPERLLKIMADWLLQHGVPREEMPDLQASSMPVRSFVVPVEPDEVVWGGERIEVGRFTLEVYWTPGHSPGHICFYEPRHRLMLTGDHVLPTITPNVSLHPQQQGNPLGDYIASLRRLEPIPVTKALPAHEHTFEDLPSRLREIERHHEERLQEMLRIIGDRPTTAYEVAAGTKWATGSFDRFSPWMKRAALSETLAHLEYLVWEGRLDTTVTDGVVRYHPPAATATK
ncbi:MAG TPA: MBL fold metallo-hydrolase [Dehalococcoidia bacterium]|nr:MBL fold metallo-hydrolase [Dehalococcoidia bacterium]